MSQSRLYSIAEKQTALHIGEILDPLFEESGLPTALFENSENFDEWCWSVYLDDDDVEQTTLVIEKALQSEGLSTSINRERLGDIDWVAETLRELSPVSAGQFFVHGSHDRQAASGQRIPIEIDAGLAFGTGHHGTTAGCLDMLNVCLKRRKPRLAMDIGTGSGVLAIALAKAMHIPVLATDIDPAAVKVAQQNSRNNGTASHTTIRTVAGFQSPVFSRFGKADIVLANILARPLEQLAHPMSLHLDKGADVILSGLLPHQRTRIVNAYRRNGLILDRWHIRDDWLTILMRKP